MDAWFTKTGKPPIGSATADKGYRGGFLPARGMLDALVNRRDVKAMLSRAQWFMPTSPVADEAALT